MKKAALLAIVLSFNAQAKEYNITLPNFLPMSQVSSWMKNIAIVDQVCKPFPRLCMYAFEHKKNITLDQSQYKIKNSDGNKLMINQDIEIETFKVARVGDQQNSIYPRILAKQIMGSNTLDSQQFYINNAKEPYL